MAGRQASLNIAIFKGTARRPFFVRRSFLRVQAIMARCILGRWPLDGCFISF